MHSTTRLSEITEDAEEDEFFNGQQSVTMEQSTPVQSTSLADINKAFRHIHGIMQPGETKPLMDYHSSDAYLETIKTPSTLNKYRRARDMVDRLPLILSSDNEPVRRVMASSDMMTPAPSSESSHYTTANASPESEYDLPSSPPNCAPLSDDDTPTTGTASISPTVRIRTYHLSSSPAATPEQAYPSSPPQFWSPSDPLYQPGDGLLPIDQSLFLGFSGSYSPAPLRYDDTPQDTPTRGPTTRAQIQRQISTSTTATGVSDFNLSVRYTSREALLSNQGSRYVRRPTRTERFTTWFFYTRKAKNVQPQMQAELTQSVQDTAPTVPQTETGAEAEGGLLNTLTKKIRRTLGFGARR